MEARKVIQGTTDAKESSPAEGQWEERSEKRGGQEAEKPHHHHGGDEWERKKVGSPLEDQYLESRLLSGGLERCSQGLY